MLSSPATRMSLYLSGGIAVRFKPARFSGSSFTGAVSSAANAGRTTTDVADRTSAQMEVLFMVRSSALPALGELEQKIVGILHDHDLQTRRYQHGLGTGRHESDAGRLQLGRERGDVLHDQLQHRGARILRAAAELLAVDVLELDQRHWHGRARNARRALAEARTRRAGRARHILVVVEFRAELEVEAEQLVVELHARLAVAHRGLE